MNGVHVECLLASHTHHLKQGHTDLISYLKRKKLQINKDWQMTHQHGLDGKIVVNKPHLDRTNKE